jgi:hypothetical protein
MPLPTIPEFRTLEFDDIMGHKLVRFSMWELYSIPENINIRFKDVSLEKEEMCFTSDGTKLAACRGLNDISMDQLIFEARVQGLLGPNEEKVLSGFKLRCLLQYEARSLNIN